MSPPARRALALVFLGLAVLLFWSLVASPLIGLSRDRRAEVAALSEQLDRLRAVAARGPGLDRRLRDLRARAEGQKGHWTGPSAAAVAAGVQDLVRQSVSASGGRLKSASEGEGATEHGLRKVVVRFSVDGTLETVLGVLAAVETAVPALFFDGLTITAPGVVPGLDGPPVLGLDADVAGYMQVLQP